MPLHDRTRVSAGTMHAFHLPWIAEIQRMLNGGLLPDGYYALAEQVLNEVHSDVAVADVPPRVRIPDTISQAMLLDPLRRADGGGGGVDRDAAIF